MKVIKVKVNSAPEVIDIDNTLEAFQEAVGGYIETISLNGDELVVCNEDAINLRLPINRTLVFKTPAGNFYNVPVLGDFVICGTDGEDFCELDADRERILLEQFQKNRISVGSNEGQITMGGV